MAQLTSAAAISHNIYCEERYTSADGQRLAFLRSPTGGPPEALWICDLQTRLVACVSPSVHGYPTSPLYEDALYYQRPVHGSEMVLTRLDLRTLDQEDGFTFRGTPPWRHAIGTISPDQRYDVSNLRVHDEVYRVDLSRGTWEVFHEHPDIGNPHPQFEPSRGMDILVQHNRGCCLDEEANITKLVGEQGATLYVIDRNGGTYRPLPDGRPHAAPVTGHECWIAKTGKVLLTTDDRSIHVVAPGDDKSTCIWRGPDFMHLSASSDGKYFVCDDRTNGRIYVGNIRTRRMLPLCDTGATCQRPQYTHPHPYMTPNNRYVIFNSDRTGLEQVWAARIPDWFLGVLDDPVEQPGPARNEVTHA